MNVINNENSGCLHQISGGIFPMSGGIDGIHGGIFPMSGGIDGNCGGIFPVSGGTLSYIEADKLTFNTKNLGK